MFGSEILEVAIGLVFIFLVTSLAASAVREIIESVLKTRAVQLERGIRQLLDDPSGNALAQHLYGHPLLYSLFAGDYDPNTQLTTPFPWRRPWQWLLSWKKSPSTSQQATAPNDMRLALRSNLPAYVPARNFALALMDLVGGSGNGGPPTFESLKAGAMTLPDGRVKKALLVALAEAEGDLDRARTSLEAWFDGTMDRVSGWYKRETQVILIVIGFVLAFALNIDSIGIFRDLSSNNSTRARLISQVDAVYPGMKGAVTDGQPPKLSQEDLTHIRQGLSSVIGWEQMQKRVNAEVEANKAKTGKEPGGKPIWLKHIVFALPGWLLTAVAVSLGAPFWFDTLNKIMVIRSTVKPYEKSPPEGSEDRRGPPPSATRLAPVPGPGPGPADAPVAGPGPAPNPAGPVMAHLRIAVDQTGLDPGSATLTIGGKNTPVPPDGFVEVPLPVDARYQIDLNATSGGTPVNRTKTVDLGFKSEGHPLDI